MSNAGKVRRQGLPWGASMCVLMLMVGCGQQPAAATASPQSFSGKEDASAAPRNASVAAAASGSVGSKADGWGSKAASGAAHSPEGLTVYASSAVGASAYCVVGAISEDGTDQRPYIAISNADQGKGKILGTLEPPLGDYARGRATRCLAHGGSLYALVEFDTQLGAQVSQTLLEVFKIDAHAFSVSAQQSLKLRGAVAAYSLWMPEDDSVFAWVGDELRISGNYFPLSDRNNVNKFEVNFDGNLAAKEKE